MSKEVDEIRRITEKAGTAKVYYDQDENPCTLPQMLKKEPEWVLSRFQRMEHMIVDLDSQLQTEKERGQSALKNMGESFTEAGREIIALKAKVTALEKAMEPVGLNNRATKMYLSPAEHEGLRGLGFRVIRDPSQTEGNKERLLDMGYCHECRGYHAVGLGSKCPNEKAGNNE